jgi:(2Fe-2S) ferredoxin
MLNSREDLIKLRAAYKESLAAENKKILVCAGTGCISSGSLEIYDKLLEIMQEKNIKCSVELAEEPHSESLGLKKCGCHGFCEMGPLLRIEPQGYLYTKVKVSDCEEIIEETIVHGEHIPALVIPIVCISNRSLSIFSSTHWAEILETSCSDDCPPKSTVTFILSSIITSCNGYKGSLICSP